MASECGEVVSSEPKRKNYVVTQDGVHWPADLSDIENDEAEVTLRVPSAGEIASHVRDWDQTIEVSKSKFEELLPTSFEFIKFPVGKVQLKK